MHVYINVVSQVKSRNLDQYARVYQYVSDFKKPINMHMYINVVMEC
jgi:hypothetical protein